MSVTLSQEGACQNGAFQSFRPHKALMLYSQRRNSLDDNQQYSKNMKLPTGDWSKNASQNIELKLTCKEAYIRDTSLWTDMQFDTENTNDETKYFPPKKRFLEKAEMEADHGDIIDSNAAKRSKIMDPDYLGVSTKCLKETIIRYRNAIEAESNRSNTKPSEFLLRTFGDAIKNNNLNTEKNMNLGNKTAQESKTEPYYRFGYKKFTLRRIEEDSNDSNVTKQIESASVIKKPPEVKESRGKRNRACKGVRYQQFMVDTLTKRQNKKMGKKKLLTKDTTAGESQKGKKKKLKEETEDKTSFCITLPVQSRRETRNSAKAAATLHKQVEDSNGGIVKIKIKLNNLKDDTVDPSSKYEIIDPSSTTKVLPKKRFRSDYEDNSNNDTLGSKEPKRLPSPICSESSSSRLSSPESNSSSSSSTLVHYKKRVSRTFAESQSNSMNPNVNLQTLADVALLSIPF
ncbi:uncharacterized protein LOC126834086 isoform X2 [Adelges cooleyi]|uniref:uncharacterized protein LOC126834086 isoform X2 n=1 Tax=Adelges cooleyi TaxID=133065 RepID=UPI0021803F2B|nr:uncharacterized protein LOC126834086 isoform X2 [Adelges cooleyi]